MRLDKVEICNMALSLSGGSSYIQSLDDQTPEARRCKQLFDACLEIVLRSHSWNCSSKIEEISQSTTTPATLYDYAYPLPHDCIRVIAVFGDADNYSPYDRWRVIGRNIETDLESVYLHYVYLPEDMKELDVLLADSVAHQLALKLSRMDGKDEQMHQLLQIAYERTLQGAKAIDTLENKQAFTENSPWEDAREGEY